MSGTSSCMIRVPSPLPSKLEDLVTRVIGCCISVHRELGAGLLESIYSRAIDIELRTAGIPFAREVWIPVRYRGELLCRQRLDIVVGGELLIEVKAVDRLNPVHQAQILSYLRIAKLRVGLLMNFNVPVLHQGLKRFVL
jgi:GxxExxY protein